MRQQTFAIHYDIEKGASDYIVPLTLDFQEEEGKWVGVCLEIGTSAFADTLEELRKEIGNAVTLQLDEIERLGFLDEFLQDHNVRPIILAPPTKGGAKFELAGV